VVRALVSIGTNSTRLLVLDGERRLAAESRGTRIGTGIGASGALDPAARERTLAAIAEYVGTARRLGVAAIDAVATSALRRAGDAGAFADQVARLTGVAPRVLSGEEEATHAFLGATAALEADHPVAVLDVGGGSSELAVDTPAHARAAGDVRWTISLEVGAVRLSERHPMLLGSRVPGGEEAAAFEREQGAARQAGATGSGLDGYAFTIAFKGVLLEGLEVVFIVLTFGSNQHRIGLAAAAAGLAVALVVLAGVAVRAPLARVPENRMKFGVGVMLTSFGTFWGAEGAGAHWPAGDGALLAIIPIALALALAIVAATRRRVAPAGLGVEDESAVHA